MFDVQCLSACDPIGRLGCEHPILGDDVAYRDFARPAFATREHSVDDWLRWLEEEGVLVPTAPRPDESCVTCQGAVGSRDDGDYWSGCYQCMGYNGYLDAFVPITYSLDSGLESLLHRIKDFGDTHRWIAGPLGSLLYAFLREHRDCLEDDADGIDVASCRPAQ